MDFISYLREGLKLAGKMAWATWWALVLGFTITGAVEACVSVFCIYLTYTVLMLTNSLSP